LPGDQPLSGLRICLDLANGAAGPLAGPLFRKLGAKVHTIFDEPNGVNINAACGSTEPTALAQATRNLECDLGVAFDGDADRAVLVDELGVVWDGDAILMLWALALQREGKLIPPRIVATTMSNLGLQVILGEHKIEVVSCDVGDRQVVEAMQREGIVLGGEQSGHVIYSDVMTTGDGLMTALQVAYEVKTSAQPLSMMLRRFPRFPQVLRNVRVKAKPDLSTLVSVQSAVQDIERTLGDQGRLVLRYSGTEPLARVMIEGPDETEVETLVDQLIAVIQAEIGE
jgi:phosphoglucosamine mutase